MGSFADDATDSNGNPSGTGTSGPITTPNDGSAPSASNPPGATVTPEILTAFKTPGNHSRFSSFGLPLMILGCLILGLSGVTLRWSGVLIPLLLQGSDPNRAPRIRR